MSTNQPLPNQGQTNHPGSNLAMFNKDIADAVSQKILQLQNENEIHFPQNYSVENALKSAWLVLQSTKDRNDKPVLQSCTHDSIANAMLDMVIQGLTPAKGQGYFAAYGTTLVWQRMYFGNMAIAKMVNPNIQDIDPQVVYEGDLPDFEYAIDKGVKRVTKHVQKLTSIDPLKIAAAYCTIVYHDGTYRSEIMTIAQIIQAWKQGPNYKEGGTGVHQKFTADMAMKTVVNKICKPIIKSSNDKTLLTSYRRGEEIEAEYETEDEIAKLANSGPVIEVEEKSRPETAPSSVTPIPSTADKPVEQPPLNLDKQSGRGPGF